MTPFRLGLHYVDQVYSDAQRTTHLDWLRKIRPDYINILGGAQIQQAIAFAHDVRRQIPETKVIFRHYVDGGDDGLWQRIPDPGWFVGVCEIWGYDTTDWYILTDNEANAADLTPYAKWTAAVIKEASKVDLRLAVGRFSTHNPKLEQINAGQLDPLWKALAEHPEHIWSPNAYFYIGNNDGMKRIAAGVRRMKAITGKDITPVIGEFAFAQQRPDGSIDSGKGYRASQLSSAYIVGAGYDLLKQLLPDTPACWYCVGEWPMGKDTFGLDDAGLKKLTDLAKAAEPELPPPPPRPEPPALPDKDSDRWTAVQLLIDKCRIRSAPFLGADILITVGVYSNMAIWTEPNYEQDGYRWCGAKFGDIIGWMALVGTDVDAQFKLLPPPPEPEPEPPPPTKPNPVADFLKVLQQQHKYMTINADNINAKQAALDSEAQLVQSALLELEHLIETYSMETQTA